MAKKEETISLLDTFQEFKESKNIDRTTMISVLEESFRRVIVNIFGTDENYSVIVNPDRGDFEIQRRRTVVADKDVKDSNFEIGLSEAQLIDETFEEGEEVSEIVNFAESSAVAQSLTFVRLLLQRFLSSRRTAFTTSTARKLVRL